MSNSYGVIGVVFYIFTTLNMTTAQVNMMGQWKIVDGWLGQDSITLVKTKDTGMVGVFKFTEYGQVLHMIDVDMSCKVGLFQVLDGQWFMENDVFVLNIKGQKTTEFYFHYHIRYQIYREGIDTIKLLKKEILTKMEVSDWHMTWDDFINSKEK